MAHGPRPRVFAGPEESEAAMSLPSTEPFRREHLDLLGHVERLPVSAHELPSMPVDERIELMEEIVAFIAEMLLPHVEVEERVLYPGADRLLGDAGNGGATAHVRREARARMAELAEADPADPGAVQEILYALHALLWVHLEHEAEVYLKLIQTQADEPVRRLFRRVAEQSRTGTPTAS